MAMSVDLWMHIKTYTKNSNQEKKKNNKHAA